MALSGGNRFADVWLGRVSGANPPDRGLPRLPEAFPSVHTVIGYIACSARGGS